MMNSYLDDYSNMINSFRTNDLQVLLATFGRNKAGRKSELRDRALELLRSRSSSTFNHQTYLSKIAEISRSMQSDMPNNNDVMRLMQNQRQQQMMAISNNMTVPSQRMYQPPQYSQQPMQMITRAGLPQVMPQMQRGIYGNSVGANTIQGSSMANNNIQYLSGNYQMAAPRTASQLPMVQQITVRPTDALSADSNAYMPSAQVLSQIRFKALPFYDVASEIIRPTLLAGTVERPTLQNAPRDMKERVFKFTLTIPQVNIVSTTRDFINGQADFSHQYQIRICQLEPGCTEVTDYMPLGLVIRVNGKSNSLPPAAPNSRPGTETRRSSRPINCTQNMKISPLVSNVITINWIPDKKNYAMGMYVVKKLTTDDLIQNIIEKGSRSTEETRNDIIKKLAEVDPDLATTSYRFSLVCPIGKMRMKIPAKSIHCNHLQCFDATIFILMNEKKPTWMCPTCNNSCLYNDIQIQNYFLDVVTSPTLMDHNKEIEILSDGTWKVYEENNERKSTPDTKEKPPIDSIDLDTDDDEPTEQKQDGSAIDPVTGKLFIDLTITDDEERRKLAAAAAAAAATVENEALAVDNIEVITVELKSQEEEEEEEEEAAQAQAQVQPQQAVTSSEQEVVIEIDSPSPPTSPAPTTEDS